MMGGMTEKDFILLDGGMGSELRKHGLTRRKSIWSGFALIEAPDTVVDVHRAYIDAGADVIITNNYGIVPSLLALEEMDGRLTELCRLSAELACRARDQSGRAVRVAGALPPLGTSYRPDRVQADAELIESYTAIAAALAPGVDLLLTETLSTAREAYAAATAAAATGRPVWVSWTLDKAANGCLRSGESIADAVAALDGLPVQAFLFNCCSVEAISAGLPRLRALTDRPIGGYANSFGRLPRDYVMGESEIGLRDDLHSEGYLDHAANWRDLGASIIGGCCGIGPEHIRLLDKSLRAAA